MTTRRKLFDPNVSDLRPAMHWLWKRKVPRKELIDLFKETGNYISNSVHNQDLEAAKQNIPPKQPDLSIAEDEIEFCVKESDSDDLEAEVERLASSFWQRVRNLDGVLDLGLSLRKVSRPGDENVRRLRLRSRLKHLQAETYLHAGYAKTTIDLCDEALTGELTLYDQTHSCEDLKRYSKTLMLSSLAHIMRAELESAWTTLRIAKKVFKAAAVPIDPELYRQRASILMSRGDIEGAHKQYDLAYQTFPAHRAYLGYGEEDHSRYDVGIRPLAVLYGDLEEAEHNLEVAQQWPVDDIHRAINLNWAAAAAFKSTSANGNVFAQQYLKRAKLESAGFGHQMTITRLLELTPRIPEHLRNDWVLFSLQYNAYRNK